MTLPTVSFIIATLDSGRTIEKCLKSIRSQNYPQKSIEIIIVDAGSRDSTISVSKRHDARIFIKKNMPQEPAKGYGLSKARGTYIVAIDSDNIIPYTDWLKNMITPLVSDKTLTASYPLRYTYDPNMTLFNRCVALYGVNDPIPYFLGKADRQSYHFDMSQYRLSGASSDKGAYFRVQFTPGTMPTLGANGFVIKKSLLNKANVEPDHFFHIDVIYDLVKKGYQDFAVVKTDIIHDTANTLLSLILKRDRYFKAFYILEKGKRRYFLIRPGEIVRPILFAFYSLTLIGPLLSSIRGYIKIRDRAWFVYPIFCLAILYIYTEAMIRTRLKI